MLTRVDIDATLSELDSLYNASAKGSEQVYYSKIALMELCGWIEESIRFIAESYNTNVIGPPNEKYIRDYLENRSGFTYKSHLRKIVVQLVGMVNVVKIETNLKSSGTSYSILATQLAALSNERNPAAHTHITGTPTFSAPSLVIAELNQIYKSLCDLEVEINLIT